MLGPRTWLVYYISKPLIGTCFPVSIVPASLEKEVSLAFTKKNIENGVISVRPDYISFSNKLNQYPRMSGQLQTEVERLLSDFFPRDEKPLPQLPLSSDNRGSRGHSPCSTPIKSANTGWSTNAFPSTELCEEEIDLRRRLESVVYSAVDVFQTITRQTFGHLGDCGDFTGLDHAQLVEQYVSEKLDDTFLFSRICVIHQTEDRQLERSISLISDIDFIQLDISTALSDEATLDIAITIAQATEVFKKIRTAQSPCEMTRILLKTLKVLTDSELNKPTTSVLGDEVSQPVDKEKHSDTLIFNADVLFSLLLIVVIRSSVEHLRARLIYMYNFNITENTEGGEVGYAISTFEAVLAYMMTDSGSLRKYSRRNRQLWKAIKQGDLPEIKRLLPSDDVLYSQTDYTSAQMDDHFPMQKNIATSKEPSTLSKLSDDLIGVNESRSNTISGELLQTESCQAAKAVSFEHTNGPKDSLVYSTKPTKRVLMDINSNSSISDMSNWSVASTSSSDESLTHDTALTGNLSRVRNAKGESLLMLSIIYRKDQILRFFLDQTKYYGIDYVLQDKDIFRTTLLSSAIQRGHLKTAEVLLHYIRPKVNHTVFANYLSQQDRDERTVAHYLFHQPFLIPLLGPYTPWRMKDKNGQTPLFALCRSYDHEEYSWMVHSALKLASETQPGGPPLNLDDHVDCKGNTLLHIVSDARLIMQLLETCDGDINASNHKKFTPLMVASRFGRLDMIKALFRDKRIDISAKDYRGLSAMELAKNDNVRNLIDELTLLMGHSDSSDRTTSIVRSVFMEDGSIRLLLKSVARHENLQVHITTCRRTLQDFCNLFKWLAIEHPASWLPSLSELQSPFLIPSKPSRAVLYDTQIRLDKALKMLLQHTTFAAHELLWEFFLVPEVCADMLDERTRMKAAARVERVKEEFTPVQNVQEIEDFVSYVRENTVQMQELTSNALHHVDGMHLGYGSLSEASNIATAAICTLSFLPRAYKIALHKFSSTLVQSESTPFLEYHYDLGALLSAICSILSVLDRPANIIGSMKACQNAIDKQTQSVRRSDKWPFVFLDETRNKMQKESADKVTKSQSELESLASELRYTQQTIANEVAGWQEMRPKMAKVALKNLAKKTVIKEKARLQGMQRALRVIKVSDQ